ncbi:GCN5 family acetyltransferase [Thermotoga sp. Ku-13t]|uniref:GNAT family N-acetyltransferase n=1 Tax=Thermotoga sp. Ku-13t TaxID=1755813 RepID=UPI0013ECA2B7|nr:GNAT family N-acetyltransferase [Thermotoga sp. Ku-13t]KAF2958245.1 GCN5 family acetyltransferase [Thermotoga sp. Ku-13t]
MEGVTIRWVRLSDAPQLVAFKKAVTSESPFLLTHPDEVEDVFEARRFISIYLTDDRRIFLVAEYQGEIVGMITLAGSSRRKILHKAELGISVRKPYWGKGIGSALISEALRIAKQKGFKKIQLEVMEHNERAIRLYKKFGFEVEGRKKKAICMDGQYFDLLVMGKWLED